MAYESFSEKLLAKAVARIRISTGTLHGAKEDAPEKPKDDKTSLHGKCPAFESPL